MEFRKGDIVSGTFGTGRVTDIGDGWIEDHDGNPLTDVDDLVRIQFDKGSTYTNAKEIKRDLSAEKLF